MPPEIFVDRAISRGSSGLQLRVQDLKWISFTGVRILDIRRPPVLLSACRRESAGDELGVSRFSIMCSLSTPLKDLHITLQNFSHATKYSKTYQTHSQKQDSVHALNQTPGIEKSENPLGQLPNCAGSPPILTHWLTLGVPNESRTNSWNHPGGQIWEFGGAVTMQVLPEQDTAGKIVR
jgi:hypothetical protein